MAKKNYNLPLQQPKLASIEEELYNIERIKDVLRTNKETILRLMNWSDNEEEKEIK